MFNVYMYVCITIDLIRYVQPIYILKFDIDLYINTVVYIVHKLPNNK